MPKHMRADVCGEPRSSHRRRHLLVDHGLVQMKARGRTPPWIAADPRGRTDKLPGPVRGRVRIRAIERERQDGATRPSREIALVLALHLLQVHAQPIPDRHGKHRPDVFLTLPTTQDDLMPVEVDVLDAEPEAILISQPSPIQDDDDDPDRARQLVQDAGNVDISAAPILDGCVVRWKTMYRRIQWTYASSVRRL